MADFLWITADQWERIFAGLAGLTGVASKLFIDSSCIKVPRMSSCRPPKMRMMPSSPCRRSTPCHLHSICSPTRVITATLCAPDWSRAAPRWSSPQRSTARYRSRHTSTPSSTHITTGAGSKHYADSPHKNSSANASKTNPKHSSKTRTIKYQDQTARMRKSCPRLLRTSGREEVDARSRTARCGRPAFARNRNWLFQLGQLITKGVPRS